MEKTFYQVLTKMSEIALSGSNECFIGDVWEVEGVARKYPLMVLDSNLKNHTYQNGLFNLRVDIYLVDIVYADESNELDVLSDMTGILTQYIDYLRANDETLGFHIMKSYGSSITFQTFTEKWDDSVAGAKAEINVSVPADGTLCNVFNIAGGSP